MSEPSPESPSGTDKFISIGCAMAGGLVFVILNQTTHGKVPGGAIGGALGGLLGGLVGAGINLLRRR